MNRWTTRATFLALPANATVHVSQPRLRASREIIFTSRCRNRAMVRANEQLPLRSSDRCTDVGALIFAELRLMKQLELVSGLDHEDLSEVAHQVDLAVAPVGEASNFTFASSRSVQITLPVFGSDAAQRLASLVQNIKTPLIETAESARPR